MNPIVEAERLLLRPLTLADAETAFYAWTGGAEAMKYVSWLPHGLIAETIAWLKEVVWKFDENGGIIPSDNYIWGFVMKKTGELFGPGGLIWEDDEQQLYQVGYNISKNHWNCRYTGDGDYGAERIGRGSRMK